MSDAEFKYKIDEAIFIMTSSRCVIESPIIKLSGGEISAVPSTVRSNIIRLIEVASGRHEVVQVLTNNSSDSPWLLESLDSFPNIHLQISMDGHLQEMNIGRFGARVGTFRRAVGRIKSLLLGHSHPIEINCVISKYNAGQLIDFIRFISDYGRDDVRLNLFPVLNCTELDAFKEAKHSVERILESYDNWRNVLLPVPYYQHLYRYLETGKRDGACLVPMAVVGLYDTGQINLCPCNSESPLLGTIERKKIPSFFAGQHRDLQDLMVGFDYCTRCFTHYDLLHLFLSGEITDSELASVPLFAGPKARERARYLRLRCKTSQ
jgi:MoaA/NifB/PqqE/SkfB family radical SAM enzyme